MFEGRLIQPYYNTPVRLEEKPECRAQGKGAPPGNMEKIFWEA